MFGGGGGIETTSRPKVSGSHTLGAGVCNDILRLALRMSVEIFAPIIHSNRIVPCRV